MSIRHYVLYATDGIIDLPKAPDLCTKDRQKVYIFGFLGGLLEVDGIPVVGNEYLDYRIKDNRKSLMELQGYASLPSPMIWAEVGDHLYITLINLGMKHRADLMDPHTVHMHGAHVATQLDGFPETSFGVPMWMPMENGEIPAPPEATYFFHPEHPGTQMYHCHVEAAEHVQMGMYGAMIIYPSMDSLAEEGIKKNKKGYWTLNRRILHHIPTTATNRNFAYNNIHSYFDKEYVMLLSDIDTKWHDSIYNPNTEQPDPVPFNAVDFKPNYWLVNGRAFPDTLLPHPQSDLPGNEQINYESYVHVKTDEKFLLRMINMGYQVVPWHIHGWHFMVAGKDANLSPFLSMAAQEKHLDHGFAERGFTVSIGSGETYDLLLTADDKRPLYRPYIVKGKDGFYPLCKQMKQMENFDIPTEPVDCKNGPNLINYLDDVCQCSASPKECKANDNFFPQFYPMHNHDDYKVTNDGRYPGGQLTYIQTDAPSCSHEDTRSSKTHPIIKILNSIKNKVKTFLIF